MFTLHDTGAHWLGTHFPSLASTSILGKEMVENPSILCPLEPWGAQRLSEVSLVQVFLGRLMDCERRLSPYHLPHLFEQCLKIPCLSFLPAQWEWVGCSGYRGSQRSGIVEHPCSPMRAPGAEGVSRAFVASNLWAHGDSVSARELSGGNIATNRHRLWGKGLWRQKLKSPGS